MCVKCAIQSLLWDDMTATLTFAFLNIPFRRVQKLFRCYSVDSVEKKMTEKLKPERDVSVKFNCRKNRSEKENYVTR